MNGTYKSEPKQLQKMQETTIVETPTNANNNTNANANRRNTMMLRSPSSPRVGAAVAAVAAALPHRYRRSWIMIPLLLSVCATVGTVWIQTSSTTTSTTTIASFMTFDVYPPRIDDSGAKKEKNETTNRIVDNNSIHVDEEVMDNGDGNTPWKNTTKTTTTTTTTTLVGVDHSSLPQQRTTATTTTTSASATTNTMTSTTAKTTTTSDTSYTPPPWLSKMVRQILKDYTPTNTTTSTTKKRIRKYNHSPPRPWRRRNPTRPLQQEQQQQEHGGASQKYKLETEEDDNSSSPSSSSSSSSSSCALLFFGLPRAYRGLVLPSITRHILLPNVHHQCDVYVHYYHLDRETPGRFNEGGRIQSKDVHGLEYATHEVWKWYHGQQQQQARSETNQGSVTTTTTTTNRPPIVRFIKDAEQDFWNQRGSLVQRYLTMRIDQLNVTFARRSSMTTTNTTTTTSTNTTTTTTTKKKRLAYYPWKIPSYSNVSVVNIVKQWHSIDKVFTRMEQEKQYARVGIFRSDCVYVTPIDIALLEGPANTEATNDNYDDDQNATTPTIATNTTATTPVTGTPTSRVDVVVVVVDERNQNVVIPAFAQYPVNDRMIYGPYSAVRMWATQRFRLLEKRVRRQSRHRGMVLHSERFLSETLFPEMDREHQQAEAEVAAKAAAATTNTTTTTTTTMAVPSLSSSSSSSSSSTIVHENPDICFLRARADLSVMANDCNRAGRNRGWKVKKSWKVLEQDIVHRNCSHFRLSNDKSWIYAGCQLNPQKYYRKWAKSGTIILLD
jgi:hypothetical protein